MPLHEYNCLGCRHRFEALVRGGASPLCPVCRSSNLERLPSTFGLSSHETREATLSRARVAQQRVLRDKATDEVDKEHRH